MCCSRNPQFRSSAARSSIRWLESRLPPISLERRPWLADQSERAGDIRVPTLVLCGAEDKITPPALSRELAHLIPGARFDLIEHAGHITNFEKPDEFNTLVGAFIRGVDSRI